ncbi:MAG TPA: sigma-70 family RNA polymerase sigma factor [Acidimicrobiales bacterium]|nr:sigma-70 family RNA polymerase sigma factor [Acidimicrobiales bacterium]
MSDDVRAAVASAHREEWARILASTVRTARDIDLAEESVQDAFTEAITGWARDGIPENPGAWLTTVARRRVFDSQRRAATYRQKLPLLVDSGESVVEESLRSEMDNSDFGDDDTIRLVFMCCHPSLSHDAQMALTLRLVCGTTRADIARCFLVSETTMAARLTRAKKKIALARIPFKVPSPEEMPARLDGALGVIYLLFTLGHTSPSGEVLVRGETLREALRLARLLHDLLPDEPEVKGLLALLLVIHARQASRTTPDGSVQPLSAQDRSLWDHEAIAHAHELIVESLRSGGAGRYTLQAAIASLHAHAPTYDEVDWPQIVTLYDRLVQVWPSPVVRLNRAVAVSNVEGPQAALAIVNELEREGSLDLYHYLPATKSYLLEELGRTEEAELFRLRARDLTANEVERSFLDAASFPHGS